VDYTNLNKAYPNDSYPLPNIDRLVDGAIDHKILSFLDVYSGYNQISMHPWDKENTTFAMDSNYYYKVMLFELQNVGAPTNDSWIKSSRILLVGAYKCVWTTSW